MNAVCLPGDDGQTISEVSEKEGWLKSPDDCLETVVLHTQKLVKRAKGLLLSNSGSDRGMHPALACIVVTTMWQWLWVCPITQAEFVSGLERNPSCPLGPKAETRPKLGAEGQNQTRPGVNPEIGLNMETKGQMLKPG